MNGRSSGSRFKKGFARNGVSLRYENKRQKALALQNGKQEL
ncbi:hypothetical protein BSM4216_2552 [Bacillus smithii]|nr:hypothetical protein BSM4216_2552 [Bacillus smithii]